MGMMCGGTCRSDSGGSCNSLANTAGGNGEDVQIVIPLDENERLLSLQVCTA